MLHNPSLNPLVQMWKQTLANYSYKIPRDEINTKHLPRKIFNMNTDKLGYSSMANECNKDP